LTSVTKARQAAGPKARWLWGLFTTASVIAHRLPRQPPSSPTGSRQLRMRRLTSMGGRLDRFQSELGHRDQHLAVDRA
jgi:hypothetical protein